MDEVTEQLTTNNMKLKGLVTKVPDIRSGLPALPGVSACTAWRAPGAQMRSTRNFCLDVVLICIILALIMYLVSMFKK